VNRKLALVCAVAAAYFAAMAPVRSFVSLYACHLGATPFVVGATVAVWSFLPLFLSVPSGLLIDRLGARAMILMGLALSLASVAGTALAPSMGGVLSAQAAGGVAHGFVVLGLHTTVAALGDDRGRARVFGYFTFAMALGQTIGPPIGGYLRHWGWPCLFAGAFLITVLAGIGGLFLPPGKGSAVGGPRSSGVFASSLRLWGRPSIRTGMGISFLVIFASSVRISFLPVYLESLGWSEWAMGALFSLRGLVSLLLRPFLGFVLTAIKRGPLLLLLFATGSVSFLVIPCSASPIMLALATAATGVMTAYTQPISLMMVTGGARPGERGLAAGLRLTGNRLAQFGGPVLFGVLAGAAGIAAPFVAAGSALALGGSALILLRKSRPRKVGASAATSGV